MTYPTVSAISSPQLTYLRTGGQWSRLLLAILNPPTVYSATLASLPSSYDRVVEISFTGGTGTLANVLKGMTLYVGSTAGSYDIGIARIRKAPIANTFYIGEESEINWQPGCHLTVVADFDVWAKHINTVSDTDFRIDWDVTYSDQNVNFDPIPIMGGHRVLKLTGANVSTVFNFSNSYVIGSTISGYSVSCPTSSSITGGTTATPTIQFNSAGWHPVYLTVTAANGKTFTGMRYVYVYNDAAPPFKVFQLGDCSEDYETGGWSFTVTIQSGLTFNTAPERALCILFAEDFYGNTQTSIGQLAGCENVICVGKIAEESYNINPEQGEVTLRIQGLQYWMSKVFAFPAGYLLTASTPTNWVEMQSPTVDKVMYRILHWGSTITAITDVYLTNDVRLATELNALGANLWAQITELAFATIKARPGVDRFGRLFIEVEPQLVPAASRSWPTVMTITDKDWYGSVNLERVIVSPVGLVDVSGVVITSDGNGGALFSLSPGHVFKHYGSPEVMDRMLLASQSLSNQLAGLLLGWRNTQFPSSEFSLSANNRMIDCFPRQKLAWSIEAEDTPRGFTLSANFIPRRVSFDWDSSSGFLETHITLEAESTEQLSMDGDIPGSGGADLSEPPSPPAFPPFPDFTPILLPTDIPVAGTSKVLLKDSQIGLVYTTTFDGTPNWQTMNAGLQVYHYQAINRIVVCPNGAIYVAHIGPTASGYPFVARAPALGGIFNVLYEAGTIPPGSGNRAIYGLAVNKTVPESVMFTMGVHDQQRVYIGSGSSFSAGAVLPFGFSGDFSYGFGAWIGTGYEKWVKVSTNGMTITGGDGFGSGLTPEHVRAGATGVLISKRGTPTGRVITLDNFATQTLITDSDFQYVTTGDADPTGQYWMFRYGAGKRGKSSDYGTTMVNIANLFLADWVFANMGDPNKWIAAAGQVWITENFGTSWPTNKTDNLATLTPFPSIDIVKVIS